MSSMECHVLLSLTFLTLLLSTSDPINPDPYAGGVSIQMINGCYSTIYPSVSTKKGHQVTPTGFKLDHFDVYDLKAPDSWSGTIWAQTSCSNTNTTTFHCDAGECGSGHVQCHHHKTPLPVTLMKFKLAPKGGISFYILDLSYGFSVPVTITPMDNQCKHITCFKDLRFECPDLLAMYDEGGGKIACKSALLEFSGFRFLLIGGLLFYKMG